MMKTKVTDRVMRQPIEKPPAFDGASDETVGEVDHHSVYTEVGDEWRARIQ